VKEPPSALLCSVLFVFAVSFFLPPPLAIRAEQPVNRLIPQNPRYEVALNLNEFSLLHSSLVAGLNRYGGGILFDMEISKAGGEIIWAIGSNNPRFIDVLEHYLAEKSTDLIESINPDDLDDQSRITLKAMKSVVQKVNFARANPIWDAIQISGSITEEDSTLFIDGEYGKYQIAGNKLAELGEMTGKTVIVTGVLKIADQIEAVEFLEKKQNTMELFVMSMCPYSMTAESKIIGFVKDYSGDSMPAIEVHYIFYRTQQGTNIDFTSLHGDAEVHENLVQIAIRDAYPEVFHDYLLERVKDNDAPWEDLAATVGLEDEDINSITKTIEQERHALIQKEYDYVAGKHFIFDGSPTFVWESEKIDSVLEIAPFDQIDLSSDRCSDRGE